MDSSRDVIAGTNVSTPAAASPTVVVISSNSPVENIVAGLKSNGEIGNSTAEGQDNIDATDLTREQWVKVLTSSSVLKAWKGQPEGGSMHINRAPCAALALRDQSPGSVDIESSLPEFEIADDTYVETRESKTSLEREMTLKAFTESGIQATLSGGTQDVGFGLGADFNWQKEQTIHGNSQGSLTAVHGFYNFPRAILHLHPDTFKLSIQAERFFIEHGPTIIEGTEEEIDTVLHQFYDRFGVILPCKVTLGGRLCTTRELQTEEETRISDIKKDVRTQLNATIKGGAASLGTGFTRQNRSDQEDRYTQQESASRMLVETQGGNGLLASNITDWTASIASYRYWRSIRQDQPKNLLGFLQAVVADRTASNQISALSQYAQYATKQNNSNQNQLEISLSGTYNLEWNTKTGKDDVVFTISIHLSQPSFVKYIEVEAQELVASRYTILPLSPAGFGRGDVEANLEVRYVISIAHIEVRKGLKLPATLNLTIILQLEHFMTWGEGAEPYIESHEYFAPCVMLKWPDIELNPKVQWSLPISRKPYHQLDPHVNSSRKAPTQSIESKSVHLQDNVSIPDKKPRNILKRLQ